MKYLLGLMLLPLLLTPAFAESVEDYEQIIPSENGTLNIGLLVDPPAKANEVSKLHIGWIKPGFNKIQEHIDYTKLRLSKMVRISLDQFLLHTHL